MEDRFDRLDRFRDQRDRRLDQFLETGRQLVDGVSGRRPGQRPGQRRSGLDLDSMGRWVSEKVEWLLEEDDDWQEPWQESGRGRPESARPSRSTRRPLDAISRRGRRSVPAPVPTSTPPVAQEFKSDQQDWPEDDSFRVQRWSRSAQTTPRPEPEAAPNPTSARRALPRSSRVRAD
ncbi:hypothetical protein [Synechococcus sp. UW69]|uniref:hypothetical protein n=1 Tax=Synechococcus sp. UW69 TaxID=368493 RepID=UPI000E0FAEE7|nr:hypothetical protein [Synechococcus sp. UW69]